VRPHAVLRFPLTSIARENYRFGVSERFTKIVMARSKPSALLGIVAARDQSADALAKLNSRYGKTRRAD